MDFVHINFNDYHKKENYLKYILIGVLLLIAGIFCISNKIYGVRILSILIGIGLLIFDYFILKKHNELARYTEKKQLNKIKFQLISIFILALVVIIFPTYMNLLASMLLGLYLISAEIRKYFSMKNKGLIINSTGMIFKILIGVILIISPLFLSKFIISIISFIMILIGIQMITIGFRLKNIN